MEKHSRSRTEYLVKAKSQFKERSAATSVEIMLPLPPDAITPVVRASQVRILGPQAVLSCLHLATFPLSRLNKAVLLQFISICRAQPRMLLRRMH